MNRIPLLRNILFLLTVFASLSIGAEAATLVVTSTNDIGPGTLRSQIAAAASGDTINFTGIPANSIITLTSGQLTFPANTNLTLDASANSTVTIAAGAGARVFWMPNNGNRSITLVNLVITGGSLSASGSTGAGILFESGGALTLTNCTVSNNTISGPNSFGAGLYMSTAGGSLSITGSTFSGNTITGSNAQGGAIWLGTGGGTTIVNSTISGNGTNSNNSLGGGIYVNNSVSNLSFNHVTIAFNTSTGNGNNQGGGVFGQGFSTGSMRNTLIANNTTTGTGPDVAGTFTSDGHNLLGIGNGSTGFTNGVNQDQVGTTGTPINPFLSALANNGGVTRTHAIGLSGPAHDKGKAFGGVTTDQRSSARPIDDIGIANATGGNGSDIGAYERPLNPSAAGVGIGGRVVTADGRGIGRVMVTVDSISGGERRYVLSSPFGYFRIDDLEAGSTYVVTVSSKSYTFQIPSRVVSTTDSITELDFVAFGFEPETVVSPQGRRP